MSFGSMVAILKKSLGQVLVAYYAFAAEIVANSMDEPELLCNNHGVEFYEAYADVELQHLNLYNPDLSVHGKFVPSLNKNAPLSIQVCIHVYWLIIKNCIHVSWYTYFCRIRQNYNNSLLGFGLIEKHIFYKRNTMVQIKFLSVGIFIIKYVFTVINF